MPDCSAPLRSPNGATISLELKRRIEILRDKYNANHKDAVKVLGGFTTEQILVVALTHGLKELEVTHGIR